MATISITIPDELLDQVRKRLDPKHRDVEEYVLAALYELTSDDGPGEPLNAETEAALLEGLKSPAVEMGDAEWDAKLRRYDERARQARAGGDAQ